jgi:enoyl-CoA hydratase
MTVSESKGLCGMTMDYRVEDGVAVIGFDDGKANVVGHEFLGNLEAALDKAVEEAGAVVITGRHGMFSGGFDLEEFKKGAEATVALTRRGFEMFTRLYGHPQPLLVACTGHAVAAGAFILLAADNRVGADGAYKLSLPETAIGMGMPPILHALAGARLSPTHLTRAVIQSEVYDPRTAVEAGFLDEVVAPGEVRARTLELAARLAALPTKVYARNKRDSRRVTLEAMATGMEFTDPAAG